MKKILISFFLLLLNFQVQSVYAGASIDVLPENEVTLFLTACNRPELLKVTLESFMKYNTYPIKEAIIMEDSGLQGIDDFAHNILRCPCRIIYNPKRLGQMKSIENGSQYINTAWVFHCEEDWEFYDYGFIEDSMKILKKDEKVCCVFLRGFEENRRNSGIVVDFKDKGGYYYLKQSFYRNPDRAAGILTFNPSLRKKEISMARIPYQNWEDEGTLGYYFFKMGLFGAVTNKKEGYVKHIGWNKHVR